MKLYSVWAIVLLELICVSSLWSMGCSVSKEFHIKHAQVLKGAFEDPNGLALPGINVQLISGTKVVRHLRTNNQGAYDFGVVNPGKYKIHVLYGDNALCAPEVQCTNKGCRVNSLLMINPENSVLVH